jgi:hypothetical protein
VIQVLRLNLEIFDFPSDGGQAGAWFCHRDRPENEDPALAVTSKYSVSGMSCNAFFGNVTWFFDVFFASMVASQ